MLDVREYIDAGGRSPFTKWLRELNVHAAAKAATALERIADGKLSNVRELAEVFSSTRWILAPATASYFGRDGHRLVILRAGGTKKRQQLDVQQAQSYWEDYRKRRTQEKQGGTDQRLS